MAMYDLTNQGQQTAAPQNPPKKEPIANGKVVKESFGEQLYRSLIPEDPKTMAKNYLLNQIIPGCKKLLLDGISSLFNVKPEQRSVYSAPVASSYTAAPNPYYQSGPYQVLKIQFTSYQEAADVLAALERDIQQYHSVSVAAYYEYTHCSMITRIDYAYGWRDLRTAHVYEAQGNNGWFIDLPPVSRIGG